MSGIGHLAVGLAAKPVEPRIPVWVLIGAAELNDILYFAFTALDIEPKAAMTMNFQQGVRYLSSGVNPWSHGFFMSVVWAATAAMVAYRYYRSPRPAAIIGLVVFSHWVLDFLMHSNLPLFWDSSPRVGLGLENTGPGFLFMTALDLTLVAAAVIVYLRARKFARV